MQTDERPDGTIDTAAWVRALHNAYEKWSGSYPDIEVRFVENEGASCVDVELWGMRGSLRLMPRGKGVWAPRGDIMGTRTASGSLGKARTIGRALVRVCDALDDLQARLDGVEVWWP